MLTATLVSVLSLLSLTLAAPLETRQSGNLQPFTGALGGANATPVTNSGNADRQFEVAGDTFVNIAAALQRSCDQQFNACANLANGNKNAGFSVSDCSTQETQCTATDAGVTGTGTGTATSAAASVAATTAAAVAEATECPAT